MLRGPAGDLALRDAPNSATAGQPSKEMSPHGLMQMIGQNTGVTTWFCTIYLPVNALDASKLLDDVADSADMAQRLMAADVRVLSF